MDGWMEVQGMQDVFFKFEQYKFVRTKVLDSGGLQTQRMSINFLYKHSKVGDQNTQGPRFMGFMGLVEGLGITWPGDLTLITVKL